MDILQNNIPEPEYITTVEPNLTLDDEIHTFVNMINSNHKSVQLEGVIAIRKLLSVNQARNIIPRILRILTIIMIAPIQKVLDTNIIPKLLEIMTWENDYKFQHESAWCLTNVCSGESKFVDYVVGLGGLDILMNLLDSNFDDVIDQAIWAIGNITGDSTGYRDLALSKGCMKRLLDMLERFPTVNSIVQNSIWAISNLIRGKPFPDWEKVKAALPVLNKHISEVFSHDVLSDALWTVSYISDARIQDVINQGCVPFLVHHLFDTSNSVLIPALRALGNLVTGNDAQTNEVLGFPEFLPRIFELIQNPKKSIQKEALWTISNITAGNPQQIEMILENKAYVEKLKTTIATAATDVKTESAWAISNMISGATTEQIDRIVKDHGLIDSIPHILNSYKPQVKVRALDALNVLLKAGGTTIENDYAKYIKDAGIVEMVEELVDNEAFSAKAELFLSYFEDDEDEEGEEDAEDQNQKDQVNNAEDSQPQQKVEDQETTTKEFDKED